MAAALSFAVPGLGAAYQRAWRTAASQYLFGFALIGLLFLELHPRIACVSRYLACVAALMIGSAFEAFVRARSAPDTARLSGWALAGLAALHFLVVVPVTLRYVAPLTPYQITAQSMAPALQPGDFFMVRKRRWPFTIIERGDVVLFTLPSDPRVHVKRVVALGGDTVNACGYAVQLNGAELNEPYVKYRPRAAVPGCTPVRVPSGELFVLGDNRAASHDSRGHGTVPIDRVVGRAWFVFLANDKERIGLDVR